MKRLYCLLFGHDWKQAGWYEWGEVYYDVCTRCGKRGTPEY